MKRVWPFLIMFFLTTACAELTTMLDGEKPTPPILLLPPESLGRSLTLSQHVSGEFEGQTYKMRMEVEITPSQLTIAGLSPLGLTNFTLVQQGKDIKVETFLKGQNGVDPQYILFDLYLTYWPLKTLQEALVPLQMRLSESKEGLVRSVQSFSGEPVLEITYPPKLAKKREIIIQHHDFPYRLRITSLSAEGG